jgi:iron complex outermembrane receptor protein
MKDIASRIALAAAIAAGAASFGATSVLAQDSGSAQQGGLEEIVVTARKQAEDLQSTPVTVSAFTETALANRGIVSNADIGNFTPNVVFDTSSSFAGADTFQAFVRGVGQSDFALNTDPGVGLYVDGVYIARAPGAVLDLLDVERVEVLKGPQGTLFGRNSIGGAVNVITRTPDDVFSFKGEATFGQRNRMEARGVINIPLAADLAASLAFDVGKRDGYQDRIAFGGTSGLGGTSTATPTSTPLDQLLVSDKNAGGKPGAKSGGTVRAKLYWTPADRLKVTLIGDYTSRRDAANPTTLVEVDPDSGLGGLYNACIAGAPIPLCATSPFLQAGANATGTRPDLQYTGQFITDDIDKTYATGANFSNIDTGGVSATLDYEVSDAFSIKSISAFRKLTSRFGVDIDGSPLVFDQTSFVMRTKQYSEELQLNGKFGSLFDVTAGVYYFYEDGFQADNVPIAGGLIQAAGGFDHDTRSYALFGEGNLHITPRLTALFGIRFNKDQKTLFLNQQNLNTDFSTFGLNIADLPRPSDPRYLDTGERRRKNFSNTSIRAGLNYQVNDDLYVYATYSQGFKSGGFTTRLTTFFSPALIAAADPNDPNVLRSLEFGEETSDNIEMGFKSDFLNNHVRFNVAAFFNKYKNIQIVVQRGVSPSNENVASARINGVEAELEALPTDWLSLNATVGYLDAHYTSFDPATAPLLVNRFGQMITTATRLQNTPEWTASAAVNVKMSDALSFNLNGSYSSRVENDVFNTPELSQAPYVLMGASAFYQNPEGWSLRVGVDNLTNKRYKVSGFEAGALPFTTASYNRPREWYVTAGVKF